MAVPFRRTAVLAGAVLLLLDAAQHLVVEAAVASTWPGAGYSYTRNFVSDLGAHVAMNISFFVNGVLLLVAVVLLHRLLDRGRAVLVVLGAVYAVGMTGVALVQGSPESVADGTYVVHTVGAALALSSGNLISVLVGLMSRRLRVPAWYSMTSIALGLVGLVGLVGIPALSGEYPAAVLERISVYAINVWWLLTGVSLVTAAVTGAPLNRLASAR